MDLSQFKAPGTEGRAPRPKFRPCCYDTGMNESFEKAPLVEIVAELRWPMQNLVAVDPAGNQAQLPLVAEDSSVEAFFHRVTGAVTKHGFGRLERLVHPGFPVLLPQMIYRYRRADDQPILMQVGPGMFSINALPPYKSWREFRPWLEQGVEALLEAFEEGPPLTVILRYIDAFKPDLTDGRDAMAFATEVLGFRLELPPSLRDCLADGEAVRAALQVVLPVAGMHMGVVVSDGQLGGEPAVLMNTEIRIDGELPPDKERVLAGLDKARELAHGTFVGMTRSIHDRLQPVAAQGHG